MAAEAPATGGNDALLVMIGGIVVAALGAAATVLVAAINSRSGKPPALPQPTPAPTADMAHRDYVVGRLAVHDQRLDDGDERDEIQDRRLDQLERVLDLDNPSWRHPD